MLSKSSVGILAIALIAVTANAQVTIGPGSGSFVDISGTGTALTGAGDDTAHGFTSTVGNCLFPAGQVVVTSNGYIVSGATAVGSTFTNSAITGTSTGTQFGYSAASRVIAAFWDDLYANGSPGGTLYWQEIAGVLIIQYQNIGHFATSSAAGGPGITFQVQIFGGPPCSSGTINLVYPDTMFGGTQAANDSGASATVGFVSGSAAGNAQYSFNTPAIPNGTSLTITGCALGPITLTFSSPSGTGSLQANINGGTPNAHYQLFATVAAGTYPNGWLFGLDISLNDVNNELFAAPFYGSLDSCGAAQIGPFTGLPSGLTIYALVFDVPANPTTHSAVQAYTIP